MAKTRQELQIWTRCLMCYQPICDIACQKKVFPAGIIHALHLKNEAGAYLRSAENVSCLHCDDAKCEKACARGRVDSPIRIQEICRYVSQMKNISRESTQAELSVNFCGIRCENCFSLLHRQWLRRSRCVAMLWMPDGQEYHIRQSVSIRAAFSRFDALPGEHPFSFCGFKKSGAVIASLCRREFRDYPPFKGTFTEKGHYRFHYG